MFIFTYSAAILTVFLIAFAAFLYSKKRGDTLSLFLIFNILTDALWIGANAAADISQTPSTLIFWSGMAFIGASFSVSFFLCFVETFAGKKTPAKSLLVLFFLPSIFFAVFSFSSLSVVDTIFPGDVPAQIIPGILYTYYPYFLFGGLFYGVLRVGLQYKGAEIQRKKQIFYMLLGFFALFFGSLFFSVLLPLSGELRFFTVGPQFSVFFAAASVYAIVRHRLLDIKTFIQRGVIYSALLAIIFLCYLAILGFLQNFITSMTRAAFFSGLATTAFGILFAPQIERQFRRMTDAVFFKDHYQYGPALRELSDILNSSIELHRIIDETTRALRQILRASDVAITLDGGATSTSADNDSGKLSIPIAHGKKSLGTIAVGPKRSGDEYSDEDLELLATFSSQSGVALEKALLFEKVKMHSAELEQRISERTKEIAEIQSEQKQMMIDISHGLQTPLTVIKGELGFLKRYSKDSKRIAAIEHSIDQVSRFIYDLLKLSALEGAEQQLSRTPISLSELIEDLVEYFTVLADERGIAIKTDIASGITIMGNKQHLGEMVTNIVGNAFKYMHDTGEKEIMITLARHEKNAVLSIRDTGRGISGEDLPRIFDRFYRVKDTSSPQEGTGLGLMIAKKIVEGHGGTISAQSTLGKETTFIITLPLLPGH